MPFSRESFAHVLVIITYAVTYMGCVLLLLEERYVLATLLGVIGWVLLHVEISLLPDWVNEDEENP